jgi:hypothetical protein
MSLFGQVINDSWKSSETNPASKDYERYVDVTLKRNDESISTSSTEIRNLKSRSDDDKIHWGRLPEVLAQIKHMDIQEYRSNHYMFFPKHDGSLLSETLEQPSSLLSSCVKLSNTEDQFVTDWLAVSIYTLLLHGRLQKNVIDYDLEKGAFVLLLTDMMERTAVIVDDYVPYIMINKEIVPLFMTTRTKCTAFPTIFEKAVVKLRGTYRQSFCYDEGQGMLYLNQYAQAPFILEINPEYQQWNLLRHVLESYQKAPRAIILTLCYHIKEFNNVGSAGSHNYLILAMCDININFDGTTGNEYHKEIRRYIEDWSTNMEGIKDYVFTCFALKCVSGNQGIPRDSSQQWKLLLRKKNGIIYPKHCTYLDNALAESLAKFYPAGTKLNPYPHHRSDHNYQDGIFWITWSELKKYIGAFSITDLITDDIYTHYFDNLPPIPPPIPQSIPQSIRKKPPMKEK